MSDLSQSVLQQLCQCLGIEPGFDDYRGIHHVASDEVQCRLIDALGFKVNNDADAIALIEQYELEPWRSGIPPVAVLHEHWDKAIEIHINESQIEEQGRWQIRCESGQILEAPFFIKELECLEEKIVDGLRVLKYRLYFSSNIPAGYHKLYVRFSRMSDLANRFTQLIVTPEKCYTPSKLGNNKKSWGLSVQLYGLRSSKNWGIGDFGDLKKLSKKMALMGADFIGLNPLHALFPSNPLHKSPYSPSSRLYMNYLYLDVTGVPGFNECKELQKWLQQEEIHCRLKSLRESTEVDYLVVAELKQKALKYLYDAFVEQEVNKKTIRAVRFQNYLDQAGKDLLLHAAYDALFDRQLELTGLVQGWHQWPEAIQHASNKSVEEFINQNADKLLYYQFLQWQCAEQLQEAQQVAKAAGMCIGLYTDLAVSVDPGGAEAWAEQENFSFQASVGAPPDPLALQGQDWGLSPLNPNTLKLHAYSTFIKIIRSNMQNAGALRIDHVMSLLRLWWIPIGMHANEAAYVYYPLDDLLGILALESQRNRCMVIGEDLGTVPKEIRSKLPQLGVYSYRVMYFEKEGDNRFKHPRNYDQQAVATITTHDLAPIAGWWEGYDLSLRDQLKLFPSEAIRAREYSDRDHERRELLQYLKDIKLVTDDIPDNVVDRPLTDELVIAIHEAMAISSSCLLSVQPENLLMMKEQVNVPGTVNEYSNWSRKLSVEMDDWMDLEFISSLLSRIQAGRLKK